MIDEKINRTLFELENGLRNLESASKQVEKTVNSYSELKNVTADYVYSLSLIDKNMKELVHIISEDYNNKSESFEKDCQTISESCHSLISSINDSVEDIKSSVSSCIDRIHKKFTYVLICNFILFITMVALYFFVK